MKKRLIALLTVLSFAVPQSVPAVYAVNEEQPDVFTDEAAADSGDLAAGETEDVIMEEPAEEEPEVFVDEVLPEEDDEEAELMATGSGSCGKNVTWVLDSSGTLTISGTGAMTDYIGYSDVPWYSNGSDIKNVVIEDGVTSIGDCAFFYCESLSSIRIPNSVISIGSSAFSGCSSLSSISIPNSVTSIGYGGFYDCSSLSSINIPNSVTSIGSIAFRDCSSLSSINIPNSVTSIGSSAFYKCSSLKTVNYFGRSTQWSNIIIYDYNTPLTDATKYYLLDDDTFTSPTQSTDSYNITTGGQYHYWEFTPTQSGTYVFESTLSSGDTYGYIYDSGLNEIAKNDDGGSGSNFKITFQANAGKTYYLAARWYGSSTTGTIPVRVSRQYTISYDANGGSSAPSSQTKLYGETLTLSSSAPSRTGCIFFGWATSSNASSAEYMPGAEVTLNRDCTLYAVWYVPKYTISYDANGGANPPASGFKTYGESYTLSSAVPSRTGYTFIGWSSSSTASTAEYIPGATYTADSNCKLYAVWEREEIISTSTQANAQVNIPYGTAMRYFKFVPSEAGTYVYESTGGYDTHGYFYDLSMNLQSSDDDSGTGMNFKIEIPAAANNTYYLGAKYHSSDSTTPFTIKVTRQYTVSFNSNEGSIAPDSIKKLYGETATLPSDSLTKSGYNFLGWSLNSSAASADYAAGSSFSENKDCTLYAVWSQISTVQPPSVNVTNQSGAISVSLSCETSGADIYYTMDGTDPTSSSTRTKYTGSVTISTVGTYTFKAAAVKSGYTSSTVVEREITFSQLNAPSASVAEGSVDPGTKLALSVNSESGVTIYYTTDGTDPKTSSTRQTYSGEITLNPNVTVKAYAAALGYKDSETASYTYSKKTVTKPTLTVTDIAGGKSVAVSGSDGVDIHYTTDGTEPTESSPIYSSPIEFKTAGSYTIKAIAVKNGFDNSDTASASVTVTKTAAPTASLPSGNVKKGTEAELFGNGTIYYSVNGGAERIYSGSIGINENMLIRAYAVENGSIRSDYAEFNYTVEKITSGTDNGISWKVTDNGVLTINGSGAIADYTNGITPWVDLSEEITTIMVSDGITVIGTNAFAGLAKVKTVSIAKSVNQINDGAFEGCTGINSITLPESMTGGIGSGAFKDCTAIQNMTVPNKVSSIGEGAFEGCTGLLSIKLPFIGSQAGSKNNIDTFGYIFKENVPEKLTSVEITNETVIPENAFAGMDKIVSIKVNSEVQTIGSGAFDGCKSLREFMIPDGITSIGDNTFRGCESAVSIPIPGTVKSIGSGAFDGCKSLKEVTIPDGIKDLYEYTFRGCSSLKKVVIPNSVNTIGVSVLEGCTGIIDLNIPFVGANKTVTDGTSQEHRIGYLFGTEDNSKIPPSVTKIEITDTSKSNYIPAEAFKNCGNIEDIIIDGGRTIGYGAFANCKNLRNLYIPKSVIGIEAGNYALNKNSILEDCTSLISLTIPFIGTDRNDKNTETSVLGGFFGYDDTSIAGKTVQYYDEGKKHNYKIPSTLKNVSVLNQTTIPMGAFSSCDILERVSIVTGAVLNKNAFSGCTSLKTVSLPQDMTEIGEEAFAECEKLENINIPEKVRKVGSNAFYNARNLKNVTMPESVKEIAEDVFNGTNIASGEVELMSDKLTITCARPSFAYDYAVRKGINTRIVSSDELNVKKTSTTVNLLSTENYLFDVTDTHKLNGVLHVEFYNDKLEKYKEETRTADDVEYRIEVTAEDMKNFSFARVYIADENGNSVTTEDELITKEDGTIPEIPKSDIELTYRNGTVTLSGTTRIKNGTVLAEAIYDNGRLVSVETYPVTSNDEEIEVSGKKGAKYMLWESLSGMKQLAEPVTAN